MVRKSLAKGNANVAGANRLGRKSIRHGRCRGYRLSVAISSHGNPFHGVAGPPYLSEGEMAVVEPLGSGQFRIVARVPRTGWTALAAAAR